MPNSIIKSIKAREILDSGGNPTVEVDLETELGIFRASVPSGVSTGKYEAMELRDENGRGVSKAVANIEKIIAPVLEKEDLTDQKRIDEILINLDGTKNKSRLGANAILPISMAVCRAGAAAQNLPLYQYISQFADVRPPQVMPKPSFNMIEGGKHAENNLEFQEFMIVPQKETFKDNFQSGKEIYNSLKKILEEKFGEKNIGLSREGAFTAPIGKITEALDFILEAAERAGYKVDELRSSSPFANSRVNDIKFAIDAAASELHEDGNYKIDGKTISGKELLEFYKNLTGKYPIILIEDPFYEEDFGGFAELKKQSEERVLIFGDDLTVSSIERINLAERNDSCSGLILKPNQIGTVSETIEAAKQAKSFGWKIMVANRAGETGDDFIADLAVGIGAEFIKSGAPFPKERMVKYNRLVKIEEEIRSVTKVFRYR